MEILLTIFYTAIFIYLIFRIKFFEAEGLSKKIISLIFILKILAGIFLWAVYTYYYTDRSAADIFKYFDDSKIMYNALWNKPSDFFKMLFGVADEKGFLNYYDRMLHWFKPYADGTYNDNRTMIRFNAVVHVFSFGYYQVHSVFMNFISLTGLFSIYKTFVPFFDDTKKELAAIIFLIPSVLLWSSGVLKEGILFFGFGMLLHQYYNFIGKKFSIQNIFLSVISLLLLFITKFYILLILLPLLIAHFWCSKRTKHIFQKYVFTLSVFTALALNIHHISPDYNMLEIIVHKQHDFINLSDSLRSGSRITVTRLEPTVTSFAKNIPQAIRNSFLRPSVFERSSPFVFFAAIENSAILLFGLSCMFFYKSIKEINFNLLLFFLFFSLLLFLLVGCTTSVLGAIARYKVPALPFLLMAFLLIFNKNKIPFHLWKKLH